VTRQQNDRQPCPSRKTDDDDEKAATTIPPPPTPSAPFHDLRPYPARHCRGSVARASRRIEPQPCVGTPPIGTGAGAPSYPCGGPFGPGPGGGGIIIWYGTACCTGRGSSAHTFTPQEWREDSYSAGSAGSADARKLASAWAAWRDAGQLRSEAGTRQAAVPYNQGQLYAINTANCGIWE
jgi:hypothetical protein